jgi:hypothetical protein
MTKEKTEAMPELTPEQQEQLVKYRPELMTLFKEVEAARIELMDSSADGISDMEFLQLVQLVYPNQEPPRTGFSFLQHIEDSRAAIKRALAGGEWKFISGLAALQKRQMRSSANHPAA